jgi:hypothetical protein
MNILDRYSVRLRFAPSDPHGRAGTHAFLSSHGRTEWTKRTAERHARDVRNDPRFTNHYDRIEVVPA